MASYNTDDTIVAISSGTSGVKKIIRISGSRAFTVIADIAPDIKFTKAVHQSNIKIDNELSQPAELLIFPSPDSYTGDDLVEIHINTSKPAVEKIIESITQNDIRIAEAGEFTARAYLNGKIGLAQAEAVAEIVSAASTAKLEAAQKLLAGKLSRTITRIRSQILDIMSLIEAGLDFSQEDMEFVSRQQAVKTITDIKAALQELLDGCIYYEAVIDMPTVGIAGVPNAGKSSLINALLGFERSIVSDQQATTRDVLTGQLELKNNRCIVFDCAGLIIDAKDILDELAQQAAVEAIKNASLLLFCLDADQKNHAEDANILSLIRKIYDKKIIAVITKSDLLDSETLKNKIQMLHSMNSHSIIITSSKTNYGIDELRCEIDAVMTEQLGKTDGQSESVAINRRHRETVIAAIESLNDALPELEASSDEIAAMFIRTAYQNLAGIENEHLDEQMLERIFSNFCIGK